MHMILKGHKATISALGWSVDALRLASADMGGALVVGTAQADALPTKPLTLSVMTLVSG
jgi:hypothetical protein